MPDHISAGELCKGNAAYLGQYLTGINQPALLAALQIYLRHITGDDSLADAILQDGLGGLVAIEIIRHGLIVEFDGGFVHAACRVGL